MTSGKLHMKETPSERAEKDLRKARKAARRAAKKAERYRGGDSISDEDSRDSYDGSTGTSRKRRRTDRHHPPSNSYQWTESDTEYGPPPPSTSTSQAQKPDYEPMRAELEEERFREKIWDAVEDDGFYASSSRLDSVEAELNSYSHVPNRWRTSSGSAGGKGVDVNPDQMDDEEYAEWIRAGMHRKKNPEYYEEQARKHAERQARTARDKAIREETKRLGREAEEERKRKRVERELRKTDDAKERYENGWKSLLAQTRGERLTFCDIPWPVVPANTKSKASLSTDDLTADRISSFLFSALLKPVGEEPPKTKKEILRETLLRFHPDKFEGRVLGWVLESERVKVMEGVGQVARALNGLSASTSAET
ncbi:hypothetical protein JAAARDRAFT_134151 [Jaapia argillacea MUCL 33604]|uniref:Uncharacterized protein n=1 Tax=Jaapia argillacea MUCL 33604 TaxID=933084 RepID=A0A067PY36_9AGAM|nr:hypothetical protein JAAARDRAFT_134151 [Jaapia argillacea MUCL 33604]